MRATNHWGRFAWDPEKEVTNFKRHGLNFRTAAQAFLDPHRLIVAVRKHSGDEDRWHCIGEVGRRVVTVRFTYREGRIRIIGAGCWRKEARFYEKAKMGRS